MPRDALIRLLPATVGTRLQKAGSNRWTSEKCLTPTNLANEWPVSLTSIPFNLTPAVLDPIVGVLAANGFKFCSDIR